MGFTGAKAQAFKWAYIDAFNKMEAALYQCPAKDQLPPPVLTEEQAYGIMSEVAKRAKKNGEHYQTIYRALKARYQVTKYTHIPRDKFDDAVEFIRTMNLSVPEEPELPDGKKYCVNAAFLERVRLFVYEWRYLHREDLEQFYKLMISLDSPFAPRFYNAVHSLNLILAEKELEKLGFSVGKLRSFKQWQALQNA